MELGQAGGLCVYRPTSVRGSFEVRENFSEITFHFFTPVEQVIQPRTPPDIVRGMNDQQFTVLILCAVADEDQMAEDFVSSFITSTSCPH